MSTPLATTNLIPEAERQTEEARELARPLDEEQFLWCPGEGAWCVGQCFTHLAESTRMFVGRANAGIEAARARGWTDENGHSRGTLFGRLFVRMMEPPPRMRAKTFRHLEPPPDRPKEAVLEDFERAQEELVRSMAEAEGIDLGRARAPSPPIRFLKWSVGQFFEAALAHNRRHLWQARRVVEHPEFPGAP